MNPIRIEALDVTRPHTLLTENPMRSGSLTYRYDDTQEMVLVTNIWYNQPFPVRVNYVRYQAMRQEEFARNFARHPPLDLSPAAVSTKVAKYKDYAKRIRAEADRMESAGLAAYPVAASRMDINYGSLPI